MAKKPAKTVVEARPAKGDGNPTDRAVTVLEHAQFLAESVRVNAQTEADRVLSEARAEADAIEARVAELRAAIPALDNDYALRRSIGLRELAAARDEITRLQAESIRAV